MANPRRVLATLVLLLGAIALTAGCKRKSDDGTAGDNGKAGSEAQAIQIIGSDTMVNLAQAWAEAYHAVAPSVSVEVSGGGSGVGIAALENGTADVADASREIKAEEREKIKAKHGAEVKEFTVGYDALAIYVNKDNPLDTISIEELGELYREGGSISKWSELGVTQLPGAKDDVVIRVSRQNSSGTYAYFREHVLGEKADYRSGTLDMNGSKEVVELIAKTPGAIGYSGMGYATSGVKQLKIAKKKGEPGVAPTVAAALDKTYPIARALYMYTPGEPPAHVKAYIDWILSPAGQKIVQESGYVPVKS
jgi:phosphate transport system substrate-binding protein